MAQKEAKTDSLLAPNSFEIKPLAMTIGAEIVGVDITRPLSSKIISEIRKAFLKWKVLFFRNQSSIMINI